MVMGRPELRGREVSVYAPSKKHLIRWKEEAKNLNLPLSGWIADLIECAIEETGKNSSSSARIKTSDEINRLRKENVELKQENKRLIAQVQEVGDAFKKSRTSPSWSVMEHLNDGSRWKWEELVKGSKTVVRRDVTLTTRANWVIVDAMTGKEEGITGTNEPGKADIIKFKDKLLYTSVKILSKDIASKTLIIRPSDKAGAYDSESRINQAEMVSNTLEQLENLGLVESNRLGWRWIKNK
jgi:hypothetical protein